MCRSAIQEKKNPLQLPGICAVLALTLALVLSTAQASSAQLSLPLAWNPGTGPIAGYMVYYGVSTGQYTNSVNAGNNLSCTLQNLSNSTYYIAAADYDANNDESSLSPQLIVQPLTASAGTGGSITPGGTFFVTQGAARPLRLLRLPATRSLTCRLTGSRLARSASYTLSNITASHTISATFAAALIQLNIPLRPLRAQTDHLAFGRGLRELRRKPDVYIHSGDRLPGFKRPGGRYVGSDSTSYTFSERTANHTISSHLQ